MADFNFGEQAGAMNNFLGQATDQARATAAYNARNAMYGNALAYDPKAVSDAANAEVATANAPNLIAANNAKAAALSQSVKDFGVSAGNPEAQSQNLANQDTQNQSG